MKTLDPVWVWACLVLATTNDPSAQDFDIDWYSVDGGGTMFASGECYELEGTIGQPDAGFLAGGAFELDGGFWAIPAGSGVACVKSDTCNDTNACTFDECVAGTCVSIAIPYGDVNGSGVVDLDDILCVIAGFGNFDDCPTGDIAPPCTGDGIIDLDDILAVIGAFGGANPCGCCG